MKQVLAYKSIREVTITLFLEIFLIVGILLLIYYHSISNIDGFFYIMFLIIFSVFLFVSTIKLSIILSLPKIILWYDEDYIYFCEKKHKGEKILFEDITFVYPKYNIWRSLSIYEAKNYFELVIKAKDKVYFIKYISEINKVKDFISAKIDQKEKRRSL